MQLLATKFELAHTSQKQAKLQSILAVFLRNPHPFPSPNGRGILAVDLAWERRITWLLSVIFHRPSSSWQRSRCFIFSALLNGQPSVRLSKFGSFRLALGSLAL